MKIRIFLKQIIPIGIFIGFFLIGYLAGSTDSFAINCYRDGFVPVIKETDTAKYYICWDPKVDSSKIDWVNIDYNILTQGEKIE